MKETKAFKVKDIYVVKNVHLQKCKRDASVSCLKIDAEINYRPKDVKFVVVTDVILKNNLRDLHLALPEINPSKVKATIFIMS